MAKSRSRSGNPARRTVESTSLKIEVGHRHHAPIALAGKDGEHLWAVFGVWRVMDPTSERFELDTENLMTIEGPGCFVCEKQYTPALAARPCPGEPR